MGLSIRIVSQFLLNRSLQPAVDDVGFVARLLVRPIGWIILPPKFVDEENAFGLRDFFANDIAVNQLADLIFIGAKVDRFLCILPRDLAKVAEEFQILLVGRDLAAR